MNTPSNKSEIVYVLTNEAMPGYVKVGRTSTSLDQRIKELNASTSVPMPFTAHYACIVKDAKDVEHRLHDAFDGNRVNPKREFFYIAPERIVSILQMVEVKDITPKREYVETVADKKALAVAREKRTRFSFQGLEIPIGAELVFLRDKNIKATVIGTRSTEAILFNGKKMSLSRGAKEALGYNYGVAGTDYWTYDGETLDERRRRFEDKTEQ